MLVAGTGVVWLARPYLVHVLLLVGVSLAVLVTGMVLVGVLRRCGTARTAGRAVVRTWLAALAVWPFLSLSSQRLPEPRPPSLQAPSRGKSPLGPPPRWPRQACAWTWSHWMVRGASAGQGGCGAVVSATSSFRVAGVPDATVLLQTAGLGRG